MSIELRTGSIELAAADRVEYGSHRQGSPFPLVDYVPAMLAEDPFTRRFLAGLDPVIASVIVALDCFSAYLDEATSSRPFTDYLGSWVGAQISQDMSDASARNALTVAARLSSGRGTLATLKDTLVPRFAERIEVDDSGSTVSSAVPTDPADWPVAPTPEATLTVHAPGISVHEWERLQSMIADLVPATVIVSVVVELGALIGEQDADSHDTA